MPPVLVPSLPQLIDDLGELRRKVAEAEVRVCKEVGVDRERLEAVMEALKARYAEHEAGLPAVDEGHLYYLEVSPQQYERDLPLKAKRALFAAMKKKLGADPLALFNVTQEAVKATLGNAAVEEYFTKERTGRRTYTLTPKSGPAAPAGKKAA